MKQPTLLRYNTRNTKKQTRHDSNVLVILIVAFCQPFASADGRGRDAAPATKCKTRSPVHGSHVFRSIIPISMQKHPFSVHNIFLLQQSA